MDASTAEFALAGSLAELRAKRRLVVHGGPRPIRVLYDRWRIFALDNRCPHMGFPLDRGSVYDGIILTYHWHHPGLISKAAVCSTCGRATPRCARPRCATAKSG